jgi:hypothetical protein
MARYVNYEIKFDDAEPDRLDIEIASDHEGFETRNFLHRLNQDYAPDHRAELVRPADWPRLAYRRVQGLEDCRLFARREALWCAASVRELSPDGLRRMMIARIADPASASPRLCDWRLLDAGPADRDQKNWMPFVDGDQLRFVHTANPTKIVNERGTVVDWHPARFPARRPRRSQKVPLRSIPGANLLAQPGRRAGSSGEGLSKLPDR